MKINIDNMRVQAAHAFNGVVEAHNEGGDNLPDRLDELASYIGAFMCVYDDDIDGDFNDVSDRVKLAVPND